MSTATEKYKQVLENKMTKTGFINEMRREFPTFVSQFNGFEDTVRILKNRSIIFEEKEESIPSEDLFSPESITRGVNAELRALGLDPVEDRDVELRAKLRNKALRNLGKDPLHYLNKIVGKDVRDSNVDSAGLEKKPGSTAKKYDLKKVVVTKNNEVPTINEALVKDTVKTLIKNILSEDTKMIKEHVTAPDHLEAFMDYKNERNPELAGRVRDAAKKLAEHVYKIEKSYLDTRENIEELFASVGNRVADELAFAFQLDISEVLKSYEEIPYPANPDKGLQESTKKTSLKHLLR